MLKIFNKIKLVLFNLRAFLKFTLDLAFGVILGPEVLELVPQLFQQMVQTFFLVHEANFIITLYNFFLILQQDPVLLHRLLKRNFRSEKFEASFQDPFVFIVQVVESFMFFIFTLIDFLKVLMNLYEFINFLVQYCFVQSFEFMSQTIDFIEPTFYHNQLFNFNLLRNNRLHQTIILSMALSKLFFPFFQ